MKRLFRQDEVAEILGLPPARVRTWCRTGLVPCAKEEESRLWFDFQGIAAFRNLKRLVEQGVSPRRLRAGLEKVEAALGTIGQPL
ncbi:MAG TPA: MerR family transcriptional regulator, partial [Thermodesulfobacteriota bacterium]|nr:MerR family transcriptional regulator [Thermodesulfobacteriota bacterium]